MSVEIPPLLPTPVTTTTPLPIAAVSGLGLASASVAAAPAASVEDASAYETPPSRSITDVGAPRDGISAVILSRPEISAANAAAEAAGEDDPVPLAFADALRNQPAELREQNERFIKAGMPHVLLVSTHGYVGPTFPASAPDSGGQIIYVNNLARELADLGYKVTIVTRAFEPHEKYASYGDRQGVAFMSDKPYVRYMYIPGIFGRFVPKEQIYPELPAIALNLAQVLADEASQTGRQSWRYVKWVNSHYVDAAVVTQMLISLWQRDVISEHFASKARICDVLGRNGSWLGEEAPVNLFYVFGKAITEAWSGETSSDLLRGWDYEIVLRWIAHCLKWREQQLQEAITTVKKRAPSKWSGISALAAKQYHIGQIVLEVDWRLDLDGLRAKLDRVNIHAFTPHSIGRLKKLNIGRSRTRVTPKKWHSLHFPERDAFERDVVVDGDRMGFLGAQPGYAGTIGPIPNLPPATVLMPTSQDIAEGLQNMGAWPGMPSFYFPPGTNLDRYKPRVSVQSAEVRGLFAHLAGSGAVSKELVDRMMASPQSFNIVVEAGRMDATKRKEILVRAMTEMPNDTILFITGMRDEDGVYDSLGRLINELGLQDRVFLLGMIPDEYLPALMSLPHGKRSDQFRLAIAASASRMEGWGMAVQEMTAGGLPLVASPFVPYAKLLEQQDRAAIIVPSGDNEPLLYANALKLLIADPEEARRMAQRGFKIAQNYGWPALVARYAEAMEEIFGGRDGFARRVAGKAPSASVHAIVLAGGPGRGMQPFSSEALPKQFIRLIDRDRTGLQLTFERARGFVRPENIWISTRQKHISIAREQLRGENVHLIGEPLQRNTAPAVAMIMQQIARHDPGALVMVLPADHFFASAEFFAGVASDALQFALDNNGLVTFGIKPDHPSSLYNYIELSAPHPDSVAEHKYFEAANLIIKPETDRARSLVDRDDIVRHGEVLVASARAFMGALGRYAPVMHSGLLRLMSGVPLEEGISPEHMRRFQEELRDDSFLSKVLLAPAALYGGELYVRMLDPESWADLETWRDIKELHERGVIDPPAEVLDQLEKLGQTE